MVQFPKTKDYNAHQSTKHIPRYIAGGGPIKQQRERGPHYHYNVQENVLYKIPYQHLAHRNPAICCAGQPKETHITTRENCSDDSKLDCGHRGSQDLEDSVGGRPSSPRYNPADEVAACEECVCSNPSRVIGARG